jgi:hypothetical protein
LCFRPILEEEAAAEGFPLVAVYGEQGPQVAGWLDRYEPRWAEGLSLLEAIVRSPWALATLLEAAGPGPKSRWGASDRCQPKGEADSGWPGRPPNQRKGPSASVSRSKNKPTTQPLGFFASATLTRKFLTVGPERCLELDVADYVGRFQE